MVFLCLRINSQRDSFSEIVELECFCFKLHATSKPCIVPFCFITCNVPATNAFCHPGPIVFISFSCSHICTWEKYAGPRFPITISGTIFSDLSNSDHSFLQIRFFIDEHFTNVPRTIKKVLYSSLFLNFTFTFRLTKKFYDKPAIAIGKFEKNVIKSLEFCYKFEKFTVGNNSNHFKTSSHLQFYLFFKQYIYNILNLSFITIIVFKTIIKTYCLNLKQSNFYWLNQWFAFSLIHQLKNIFHC